MNALQCPKTEDGKHLIEWVTVPECRLNGRILYSEHERGQCDACGQILITQA